MMQANDKIMMQANVNITMRTSGKITMRASLRPATEWASKDCWFDGKLEFVIKKAGMEWMQVQWYGNQASTFRKQGDDESTKLKPRYHDYTVSLPPSLPTTTQQQQQQ